jgi:fructose-1,6-bisphosphatase/inositol monophosphatase family enzyme
MFHFVDDIIYGDAVTLITKVGAAFISSPAWIQGTIMSQDIKGDHFKLVKDIDQDMEDMIVEIFAQSCSKNREGGFTGDIV